jgi:threonine/homoserine/homoserine lactone efflux protein
MSFGLWLGFVGASLIMGIVPGPGVLSIIGYAISSGRRTALASVAGMAIGNMCAMTLSLAGVGALLAASALAFTVLKWAGALYLIALGTFTIARSRINIPELTEGKLISPRMAFMSNVAVGIFHPKTIVFFVAFVPQFMTADGGYWHQSMILIATFTLVVTLTDSAYALSAAHAREFLATSKARLWMKRAGGGALIAAGTVTALSKA